MDFLNWTQLILLFFIYVLTLDWLSSETNAQYTESYLYEIMMMLCLCIKFLTI